jgi:hypothetical protein
MSSVTDKSNDLVIVFSGELTRASMIQSRLQSAGIHAIIKDEVMGGQDGWGDAPEQTGVVKILVTVKDLARAAEIIESALGTS